MSQPTAEKIAALQYRARDLKNNLTNALAWLRDMESAQAETRDYAANALPSSLAAALRDAEAIAESVPALRELSKGNELPAASLDDLGMSILVRYKQATDTRGSGWLATLWRDSSLTFRASYHFTYDDKNNEGSDIAAARCLEKFTEYCNSPGLQKLDFRLTGRASLGNGSYAYTFKPFTA